MALVAGTSLTDSLSTAMTACPAQRFNASVSEPFSGLRRFFGAAQALPFQ
jgi:hypothetical protein